MTTLSGLPLHPNREDVVGWVQRTGKMPKRDADKVVTDSMWGRFLDDPNLLIEYLSFRVHQYQQGKDTAKQAAADADFARGVLEREGFLNQDTDFPQALADYQRAHKINAGNAELDQETIRHLRGSAAIAASPPSTTPAWSPSVELPLAAQVDRAMAQIARTESGGSYTATNGRTGAAGKYQILPSNWRAWAQEAGLPDWAPMSAANQETVARFKLSEYVQQFGSPQAAAVAWYAGPAAAKAWVKNPYADRFNKKQGAGNEPSINEYVGLTIGHGAVSAPTSGPSVKSPAGRGPTGTVPATPAVPSTAPPSVFALTGDPNSGMQTAFGFASALADIPELKTILDQAVANKWADAVTQAAVLNSPWFKARRSTAAAWEIQKRVQPRDAQAKVADLATKIQQQASSTGFTLTPERAKQMADHSLALGLTQSEQDKALLAEYHFDPSHARGTSASLLDSLKQTAKSYLVPISDSALTHWVESITRKSDTEDSFNEYVKNQAKSMFPTLAGSIDAGHSTQTLLDPYAQVAATELNVPVTSINLTDPKWMGSLMQTDPKSGLRAMPTLDVWQTKIRTDPKYGWDGTVGAQNHAADFAQKLAQEMGRAV